MTSKDKKVVVCYRYKLQLLTLCLITAISITIISSIIYGDKSIVTHLSVISTLIFISSLWYQLACMIEDIYFKKGDLL